MKLSKLVIVGGAIAALLVFASPAAAWTEEECKEVNYDHPDCTPPPETPPETPPVTPPVEPPAIPPVVPPVDQPPASPGGVPPADKPPGVQGPVEPVAQLQTLPFTGADIGWLLVAGGLMLGAGFGLRKAGKE